MAKKNYEELVIAVRIWTCDDIVTASGEGDNDQTFGESWS